MLEPKLLIKEERKTEFRTLCHATSTIIIHSFFRSFFANNIYYHSRADFIYSVDQIQAYVNFLVFLQ